MKNLITIIFIFLSTFACSQETEDLEGIWVKENYNKVGLIFFSNNTFDIYNEEEPNVKQLQMTVKYETIYKDNNNYIIYSYYKDDKLIDTEVVKYKIENAKLYLPKTSENLLNGKKTTIDFNDVYIKLEKKN